MNIKNQQKNQLCWGSNPQHTNQYTTKAIKIRSEKIALQIVQYRGIGKMITLTFLGFTFEVYVSHTVNMLVTDYESGTFYIHILRIGSRLFELFSKEVCVKKQSRLSLNENSHWLSIFIVKYV